MVKATQFIVTIFLLVDLCGVLSDSWSSCSGDHKCPNAQTCCGNSCVDGLRVCKVECQKQADCASLGDGECVDGFCECSEGSVCSNTSILYDGFQWNQRCKEDFECTQNAKCRNRTCAVNKEMPEKLPLNPALLAIVTIIGVLMFSCLFCCCLSRMKSERKSMKSRVAKGNLKLKTRVESSDSENAAKIASLPLINAESQVSSPVAGKNTMVLSQDDEALISVIINGPGLPPIREEEEDEDADKD